MRPGQFLIRLVVFCLVALDPSGGGAGVVLGVVAGVAIAAAGAGINAIRKKTSENAKTADEDF